MLTIGKIQKKNETLCLPPSRGRLKKGKTLAKRKTVEKVMVEQEERGTKLPNITTTQLVRLSAAEAEENDSVKACRKVKGNWAKPRKIARAALKNESFKIEDAENLDGLIVSRLNNKSQEHSAVSECLTGFSSSCSKFKRNKGRLSFTGTDDSGFGEETCDSNIADNGGYSPDLNTPNIATSNASQTGESFMDIRRLETRNGFATRAQAMDCSPSKLIVRKSEKTDLLAPMCTQSHFSLHSDMMALKNLKIQNIIQREVPAKDVGKKKKCDGEMIFKQCSSLSPSLSDPSLSILKKKQKLLSRRTSSGLGSSSMEENFDHPVNAIDISRTGLELKENEIKKCVRFQLDNFETAIECVRESQRVSGASSPSLTAESLSEAMGSQGLVDVNSKCTEWLNRWYNNQTLPNADQME